MKLIKGSKTDLPTPRPPRPKLKRPVAMPPPVAAPASHIDQIDLLNCQKIRGEIEVAQQRLRIFMLEIAAKYNLNAQTDSLDPVTGRIVRPAGNGQV